MPSEDFKKLMELLHRQNYRINEYEVVWDKEKGGRGKVILEKNSEKIILESSEEYVFSLKHFSHARRSL